MSYRELDAQSRAIALSLQAQGIGQGALIGVSLRRSVRMLAALIGVLRAGAAYVPLAREFSVERLRYMIDQSGLPHILRESDRTSVVEGRRASVRVEFGGRRSLK